MIAAAGCGSSVGTGDGRPCTEIGARVGIGVQVAPPPAGTSLREAAVEACWEGSCRTVPVELSPATEVAETTCTGEGPDDPCSARLRETGGYTGFAPMSGLPTGPVQVTLTVTDADGERFAHRTLEVTPELVYPNGPDCEPGGPQAQLEVDEQGRVR